MHDLPDDVVHLFPHYTKVALFKWTPNSVDQVRVGFVATDGRANSVALPEVRVCDCQNGGVCDFGQLVDNSDIVNNKFAVSVVLDM